MSKVHTSSRTEGIFRGEGWNMECPKADIHSNKMQRKLNDGRGKEESKRSGVALSVEAIAAAKAEKVTI